MTPEGAVKKQLKAYFDRQGWYHFWPVQTGMGARTLDCLLCVDSRFVAIEVKRPGVVEPTKLQSLIIKRINALGGLAFTTDSLSRTIKYLEDHVLNQYAPRRG